MRRLLFVVALAATLGTPACAQVSRSSQTTDACTAALDAYDELTNAEDEGATLDTFLEAARSSGNEELQRIAARAEQADDDGDRAALERALTDARDACEESGGV